MISSNEFFENFQKATLYYQEILQYIMEHKIDTLALNNTNNKRNQEMIAVKSPHWERLSAHWEGHAGAVRGRIRRPAVPLRCRG